MHCIVFMLQYTLKEDTQFLHYVLSFKVKTMWHNVRAKVVGNWGLGSWVSLSKRLLCHLSENHVKLQVHLA
jgi:hypothetical protein